MRIPLEPVKRLSKRAKGAFPALIPVQVKVAAKRGVSGSSWLSAERLSRR